jgi:hypothetical protein
MGRSVRRPADQQISRSRDHEISRWADGHMGRQADQQIEQLPAMMSPHRSGSHSAHLYAICIDQTDHKMGRWEHEQIRR